MSVVKNNYLETLLLFEKTRIKSINAQSQSQDFVVKRFNDKTFVYNELGFYLLQYLLFKMKSETDIFLNEK